jgi:hypothetical protein
MKAAKLALLALFAAGAYQGVASAQGYPPPPPPPYQGYGAPPPPPSYDNQAPGYDDQAPGYDDQAPYYDDQGPDDSYGNPEAPPDAQLDAGDNPDQPDTTVFYSNLSPYGRWIQRPTYGWVWEPTRVRVGWRPYTVGRWVNSDYGWTWVSDEPWGWATYHYGRWANDPEYGWLWVPGSEWGPAWCSFQEGNGYVGWAPLPPSVGFQVGIGIQLGGLRISAAINPTFYSFVPERSFLEARVDRVLLPPARNVTLIRTTTNITNITVVNNRILNRSLSVDRIERATGRPVPRFQIDEVRNPAQAPRTAAIQGNRIAMFRPAPTLPQVRPTVTPQAVINRRAQRMAQERPPLPGQQARPDRQPRPGQPPSPQGQEGQQGGLRPQPVPRFQQPGQPPTGQAGQPGERPLPRYRRPAPTPEELDRKHQAESQDLQRRQNDERSRLQQMQSEDQRNQRDQARSREIQSQHDAEMKAQQEVHQRQQQELQARQQRERQAQQARPRGNPNQGQGQGQDRRNQNQDRRDREQKPPPPPPGR